MNTQNNVFIAKTSGLNTLAWDGPSKTVRGRPAFVPQVSIPTGQLLGVSTSNDKPDRASPVMIEIIILIMVFFI
jgi:hypothetical protein